MIVLKIIASAIICGLIVVMFLDIRDRLTIRKLKRKIAEQKEILKKMEEYDNDHVRKP